MADDFLAPFSRPRFAAGMVVLLVATLVFFRLVPEADIAVSRYFFDLSACPPGTADIAACGTFSTGSDPVMRFFRQALQLLPAMAAAAILIWGGLRHFYRRDFDRYAFAEAAVAFAALILSPLLLVNGILKEHWGRPRPHMVDLFGGNLPFVPAGTISSYCDSNCSFVSGEAAGAFWLVCLVPLVPREDRAVVFIVSLVIAASASGLRLAFGAHFLSDVMIGGLATIVLFSVIAALTAWWLRSLPSPNLSRGLDR